MDRWGALLDHMPRFYFHFGGREHRVVDAEGTDFPDLASAENHGRQVASKMVKGRSANTDPFIVVTDDAQRELLRVPIPSN